MTESAHNAAVEIAKQVFPACGDGTMSEAAIEDNGCVRRLARIIDDEFIKRRQGEMRNGEWVLVKSFARLHPIGPTGPKHAKTMHPCWHVAMRVGTRVMDEYGNKVDPVLEWRDLP